MSDAVWTVGVGRSPAMGGTALADLEAEIARVRRDYSAPDDARVIPTAPGSIYLAEVIWVGPSTR